MVGAERLRAAVLPREEAGPSGSRVERRLTPGPENPFQRPVAAGPLESEVTQRPPGSLPQSDEQGHRPALRPPRLDSDLQRPLASLQSAQVLGHPAVGLLDVVPWQKAGRDFQHGRAGMPPMESGERTACRRQRISHTDAIVKGARACQSRENPGLPELPDPHQQVHHLLSLRLELGRIFEVLIDAAAALAEMAALGWSPKGRWGEDFDEAGPGEGPRDLGDLDPSSVPSDSTLHQNHEPAAPGYPIPPKGPRLDVHF